MKTTINLRPTKIKTSPYLYGLFYEDINHGADGGINAELVSNNSFEYEYINYNESNEPVDIRFDKLKYWTLAGDGSGEVVDIEGISTDNPSFLRVSANGKYRISNCGYGETPYGMKVARGKYDVSMFLRDSDFVGHILVYLTDKDGIASSVVRLDPKAGTSFVRHNATLVCHHDTNASLVIEVSGNGKVDLDYVSLLPKDGLLGDSAVWQNGRIKKKFGDVLGNINAKMLRFPGGCIVEGDADFGNMYDWRETVGELWHRKQKANTWCYLQSFAVGFYEYFCMCGELGWEPLPVINCGILCQIRSGIRGEGDRAYRPGSKEFERVVTDSIRELIFFALGNPKSSDPTERKWAGLRADMGHRKPFRLRYLAIGNENWGDVYYDNLEACLEAVASLIKKHKITVVTSAGVCIRPHDTSPISAALNNRFPGTIIDEHVYNTPQWFVDNSRRYDFYNRSLNKVFVGEYAVHTGSSGRGSLGGESTLRAAVCEAAFLTGCERNSDVVKMTAYAPIFAKGKGYRWTPDLIWFDEENIMRTPSYFVQQMFASNVGDRVVDVGILANQDIRGGLFVGAHDTAIEVQSIRVTDNDGEVLYEHDFVSGGLGGWRAYPGTVGGTEGEGGVSLIRVDKALNGIWLDKDFGDCVLECKARKIDGTEGIILGMGLDGVKDTSVADKDAYSLWLNYGALGDKVAFEKRFEYMRTAFEVIEDKTVSVGKGLLTVSLSLYKGMLTAKADGEKLFGKKVYKSDEPLNISATEDKDYVYIKVANTRQTEHILEIPISGKHTVELTVLAGDKDAVNSLEPLREPIRPHVSLLEFCDVYECPIPAYSAVVIKISK